MIFLGLGLWVCWFFFWIIFGTIANKPKYVATESKAPYVWPIMMAYMCIIPIGPKIEGLDTTLSIIGLALIVIGLGFSVWARIAIGKNWSGHLTIQHEHHLITNGPYRWIRHPIYSGVIAAMIGSVLVVGTYQSILVPFLLMWAFWYKSKIEERHMLFLNNGTYLRYMKKTGAFLPRIMK